MEERIGGEKKEQIVLRIVLTRTTCSSDTGVVLAEQSKEYLIKCLVLKHYFSSRNIKCLRKINLSLVSQ